MQQEAGPSSPSTSPADATILVVEDDPALASVLVAALSARAGRVEVAGSGRAALDAASDLEPDVVVLDLGLPDIDGIDVCRHLRRWYRNPIVVLTADGSEERKVDAFDQGADDYVTKPFSMPELLARLRVALRHRQDGDRVLEVGAVLIDTGAREVSVDGEPVRLAAKEFDLLVALARVPGRVQTHAALVEAVWGSEGPGRIESLRVHVTGLRKKLGAGPGRPVLRSEPGVGYRLLEAQETRQ